MLRASNISSSFLHNMYKQGSVFLGLLIIMITLRIIHKKKKIQIEYVNSSNSVLKSVYIAIFTFFVFAVEVFCMIFLFYAFV